MAEAFVQINKSIDVLVENKLLLTFQTFRIVNTIY